MSGSLTAITLPGKLEPIFDHGFVPESWETVSLWASLPLICSSSALEISVCNFSIATDLSALNCCDRLGIDSTYHVVESNLCRVTLSCGLSNWVCGDLFVSSLYCFGPRQLLGFV